MWSLGGLLIPANNSVHLPQKLGLGGLAVFLAFMNLKAFLSLYLNLTLATENVLKGP